MPASTPAARAPQERPPSVWEDLLEIFYAPATVFARRRDTPAFGLALIVFAVLVLGLSFAFKGMMEPVLDAEWKRGMAQALKANPQLTPEMMEKGKGVARTFFYVAIGFYAFVTPILLGLLLWVVGKILGSKAEVGQMLMVGTYGMFPRILESVTGAAQTLFLPEEALNSRYALQLGPARFMDPDASNPLLLALAGRADLFTLWITVLFGIGLAVLGKVPWGYAVVGAIITWVIGGIPALYGAVQVM
jgi:hypothetical protein